jgi:hypothetical protein
LPLRSSFFTKSGVCIERSWSETQTGFRREIGKLWGVAPERASETNHVQFEEKGNYYASCGTEETPILHFEIQEFMILRW